MSGLVTAANPRACLSRPPMYPRPTLEISQVGLGYIGGLLKHARGLDRKSTRLNSSHSQISYAVFCLIPRPPTSPLFPYTTLFRSGDVHRRFVPRHQPLVAVDERVGDRRKPARVLEQTADVPEAHFGDLPSGPRVHRRSAQARARVRSEEHTSELQSQSNLVCRLLLDTAPAYISTLSLHDALPIWRRSPALRTPAPAACSC